MCVALMLGENTSESVGNLEIFNVMPDGEKLILRNRGSKTKSKLRPVLMLRHYFSPPDHEAQRGLQWAIIQHEWA